MTPDGKFTIGTNRKLGPIAGSINRVPVETCPGSSTWCEKHCYALRGHFPFWFDEYGSPIDIPNQLPKLVRLHSCGDFDTVEYIRWVIDLVESNPHTSFWAYTRSWRVNKLLPLLEELRSMNNFHIFASIDPLMDDEPPEGWRIAWVETDPRAEGTFCPHDKEKLDHCTECGICYEDNDFDVIFKKK
jgi:hypothetical protein